MGLTEWARQFWISLYHFSEKRGRCQIRSRVQSLLFTGPRTLCILPIMSALGRCPSLPNFQLVCSSCQWIHHDWSIIQICRITRNRVASSVSSRASTEIHCLKPWNVNSGCPDRETTLTYFISPSPLTDLSAQITMIYLNLQLDNPSVSTVWEWHSQSYSGERFFELSANLANSFSIACFYLAEFYRPWLTSRRRIVFPSVIFRRVLGTDEISRTKTWKGLPKTNLFVVFMCEHNSQRLSLFHYATFFFRKDYGDM